MQRPEPMESVFVPDCRGTLCGDRDYCAALEAYADHLETLVAGLRPEWLEGFKKLCDVNAGDAVLLEVDPDLVKEAQLRLLALHMAKAIDGVKLFVVQKGMTAHNLANGQSNQHAMRIVDELRKIAFEIEEDWIL